VPHAGERLVHVIVYASHFVFHGTFYVCLFIVSSPEALAALFRVRWDGEASS
jgi:hypothetical protein